MTLDIATGARKEGRFMFTDGQVGRQVADTFEKIMAYGGLLASPCLRPPQLIENVHILVVPEGEMGTGDCAGKMSTELAQIFGKDGSQAGQFRLGIRLNEDTIVVGKGTLKQMDWLDPSTTPPSAPLPKESAWDCRGTGTATEAPRAGSPSVLRRAMI